MSFQWRAWSEKQNAYVFLVKETALSNNISNPSKEKVNKCCWRHNEPELFLPQNQILTTHYNDHDKSIEGNKYLLPSLVEISFV